MNVLKFARDAVLILLGIWILIALGLALHSLVCPTKGVYAPVPPANCCPQ